jgi:phage recombination protein Bet
MNEIVLAPASMPMPAEISREYGVTAGQWRVLVDQLFPAAKSQEAIAMALAYCRQRNLDVFKKPVHIVPMYSTALGRMVETVWPGIAEIRTTAARTGEYIGIDAVEFGPLQEREFVGVRDKWENKRKVGTEEFRKRVQFPEWASVVVWRFVQGQQAAFHAKVYWLENYATVGKMDVPNDMWAKRPFGQLEKCVEAAALRKAFPEEIGGTYTADEMEGHTIDHEVQQPAQTEIKRGPQPPTPPDEKPEPAKVQAPAKAKPAEKPAQKVERKPEPPKPPAEEKPLDGEVMPPSHDFVTGDDEWPEDDTDFLTALDEALERTSDLADLEDVWTSADPMARFEGDEINQGIVKQIKRRNIARVTGNG